MASPSERHEKLAESALNPVGYYYDWDSFVRDSVAQAIADAEARVRREYEPLVEALREWVGCRVLASKFDHSGFMNATQLHEREFILRRQHEHRELLRKIEESGDD